MSDPLACDPALVVAGKTLADPWLSPDGARLGWLEREGDLTTLVVDGEPVDVEVRMPHPMGGGAWHWDRAGRPVAGGLALPPDVDPDLAIDPTVGGALSGGDYVSGGDHVVWHEWDEGVMPFHESRLVRRPRPAGSGGGGSGERAETIVFAPGVAVSQPRFSLAGDRLAWISDATGWRTIWVGGPDGQGARPLVAGDQHEHGGPTWGPGQRTYAWSPDGRSIAFNRNEGGFGRLCVAEVGSGAVRELGKGWHWALSWAGGRIAALRGGARTPTQLVTYDARSGERTVVARGPSDAWDAVALVEPEPVRWRSTDGVDVPGRIYRPAGATGPLPLLAWIHGGPTDQMQVTFNARVAYFVARGWAVLVPDHRGTSGWGRAWEDALHRRWGDVDVADTVAGIRHAVERGWADAGRVVAIGGSAGGATALRVAARHPDAVAGAVALYPVVDLTAPSPSRFEARYHEWLVGDPHPIDRLDRPVLVLHGAEDTVVPVSQSVALRSRFPDAVTLHVYEGEGHSWKQPATTLDEVTRVDAFLASLP